MNTTKEKAKSNQWWYSNSSLRSFVENSLAIELSIDGRRCILGRSETGSDGRDTLSFKFLRDDDRAYWTSFNGRDVLIELINKDASTNDVEEDQEDEFLDQVTSGDYIVSELESKSTETTSKIISLKDPSINLFDAYIFVDWSANSVPKRGRDSIWIAEGRWEDGVLNCGPTKSTCLNSPTRESATAHIRSRLYELYHDNKRVLVCFDFAYSYPQCEESSKLGTDFFAISRELATRISDNDRNNNNRFQVASDLNDLIAKSAEGPFWGRPTIGKSIHLAHLNSTKPRDWPTRESLKEFRIVESRLRDKGARPFSVWQLFGNGSVGSQVLLGIPRLHSLRHDPVLSEYSTVWPFETGWGTSFKNQAKVVHAEFWPGAINVDESLHPVRDASQVLSCVNWAASLDAAGQLASFFDPLDSDDQVREVARNEGWILGFSDKSKSDETDCHT